jgi:hypothetical protein
MKPILTITILIGTLCLFSCDKEEISDSQKTSFIKYYTNFPVFKAADVAVTENGFAILGTVTTSENKTQICLIRTDEFGNSVDTARLYGPNQKNTAYCLKSMNDGGFAILGSTLDPQSNKLSAYFIRTNNLGEITWTRTIRHTGNLEARYFETNSAESYFLTGYCDSIGNGKQIWWLAIDNEGKDLRSQRKFGLNLDDEGTHLQILPDGGLVIAGYITRTQNRRPIIIKTNENGVYEDAYELLTSDNETGNCIRILDESNFLLLGNRSVSGETEMTLRRVFMSSTQPHSITWEKTFSSSTNDESNSLIADNQSLYIAGTSALTGSNSRITITTTDLEGNETNHSEFGAGSHLTVASFKRTSDNGFIVAGTNENPEANNTSFTLIKTRAGTGL